MPELQKQIDDLEELRTLIQTNQDKLFSATIFITLNAESLDELNEKTKILESELSKKTAMIRTLTFRQLEGLKTILPIRRTTNSKLWKKYGSSVVLQH